MMSSWGPLIYAGCFAATLSTSLTNLLSVPRLLQAIGNDRIYPGLIFFSKGYGKNNEAYRGYVLTFIISVGFLLIGKLVVNSVHYHFFPLYNIVMKIPAQLNAIAPLITNFYLASYALINFCTFHAALIKPLGWRPTYKVCRMMSTRYFKTGKNFHFLFFFIHSIIKITISFQYYNMWLSLLGFILCVGIMFLIDWVTSLITLIVIFALYLVVVYRKPGKLKHTEMIKCYTTYRICQTKK